MQATPEPQAAPTLDVEALRAQFPALQGGAAHFDGPGGSQVPQAVADAISRQLTSPMSTRGEVTAAERNSDAAVRSARQALGDLMGTDPRGVVFGRSMTALTFELARTLAKHWGPGDEVVVSRLDHDANIRPWLLAAEQVGATVRWAEFDPTTGELPAEAVGAVVGDRTRLVAVTAASNLIGTKPDLPAIAALAHDRGALLFVDAVHLAPHGLVDRVAMGADLVACSPYKFFGPHCGALAAAPELLESLHPDKLVPSSDAVPERFELGTLPYESMAGVTAAIDVIAGIVPGDGSRRERLTTSLAAVAAHELQLREELESRLAELPGATVHSRAEERTPTFLVTFEGHDSKDVSRQLAARGVNAPAGHFYALEASRALGLGDTGGLRIGLASYTDTDDLERLLAGLGEVVGR
ncbi:cysteine desulfurase-like protein [Phycicoccus sp. M110.8]|uniref:cysteine desulfurase-like protein n=1 Tax=Phycicoccus sp. M110.8 TaxID=3075433 RepID=UPI0028FD2CAD|nr:cysteine desulfurase-like protein [Phycicoccus sp. M110.8]MDU0313629.1 cysteine desulfurase-like protein [Phycicoccus sp. M110.8]